MARTSLQSLVFAGAILATPAAATSVWALDDLNWLAPDADRAAALTTAPAECLARPADPEQAWRVSLGQVAFRSPALLGGLAARSGISCDTCHRNGHGNPAFFIAGVSGSPGTADVTSAIFSQTRGDDTVNPVPIPDLTGAGGKSSFGTMRPAHDLPGFLHAVTVDEFQGREPAPAIADGLVAYVAALEQSACPAEPSIPLTLGHAARELSDTHATLLAAMDRGERDAADFVLRSLNLALGRLAQRFPGAPEAAAMLPALGRDLGTIRPLIRDDPDAARRALAAWRIRLDGTLQALAAREADSLFNRQAVERFLAGQ